MEKKNSRSIDLVSRSIDLLSRSIDLVSRMIDLLSRSIDFRNHGNFRVLCNCDLVCTVAGHLQNGRYVHRKLTAECYVWMLVCSLVTDISDNCSAIAEKHWVYMKLS